jgi:cellulose synthase/poly-beta-1,6-N-acetylglucosamine synthase-like glycosyltransferase
MLNGIGMYCCVVAVIIRIIKPVPMFFLKLLLAIYCLKVLVYFVFVLNKKIYHSAAGMVKSPKHVFSVDIVLPMYNEETVVVKTIENLLGIAYADFSIIVIDDGSTDQSFEVVTRHFGEHPRVRIIHQPNAGKSAALNRAMNASDSDVILCIDADTLVKPNVIEKILPHFQDDKVAAVSGSVKVGNRVNPLTDMQYFEYLTIQNHERAIFESVNGILVVPGALGAFRRTAVKAVGGFTSEALAEDCDITLRMLCLNYVIKNASEAMSFTEAPDTAKMFFKQRVRWTVGLVQGLLKHAKRLSQQSNKALAYLVVPYTWIYRVILPFFIPLADYVFVYCYFILGNHDSLKYYLACILIEILSSLFILLQKGERVNPFRLILLQRFYRHLTFFTYLHIFVKWLNGNLYGWGKITRQGNVKLD